MFRCQMSSPPVAPGHNSRNRTAQKKHQVIKEIARLKAKENKFRKNINNYAHELQYDTTKR